MLDETRDFYRKTKLDKALGPPGEEAPITWTKVFYKSYPRLPKIALPKAMPDGQFGELLESRQSWRDFSKEPVSLEELAPVLLSCRIVDRERQPERRTYPSAGARFPVEIYLAAFNVNGLDGGAYHYNIADESLELLWKKDLRPYEKELASPFLANTAAALMLTSVMARSEVKYGHKAYPYSLIEAGHMGQNIQLACTKYGLGCCPIGGYVNDMVSKILDLTDEEIPIYVLGIGKPCRDSHANPPDKG